MSFLGSERLVARFARAGGALAVASIFDNSIRFMRNVLLAKMLLPQAFGVMAALIAAIAMMEALAEVGIRQVVIQSKRSADPQFLNAVWWISFIRGVVLYLAGWICAPLVANLFDRPEAVALLRIGFLSVALNGALSPRIYLLEKDLQFKRWAALMQASNVSGFVCSIVLAYFLKNAWALVIGYICEMIVRVSLSHVFFHFRPSMSVDLGMMKEIYSFSRRMFGLSILMVLYLQTDTFVVGGILSIETLGIYYLVRDLADLPNKVVTRMSPAFLPALSALQGDPSRLREGVSMLTQGVALFGMPLLYFFMLFGRPLLSVVYSPTYADMVVPFRVLCISTVLYLFSTIIMQAYISVGKPQIQRKAALARTAIFLVLIYPMTRMSGVVGASSTTLAAMCASFLIQLICLEKAIGLRAVDYLSSVVWCGGYSLVVLSVGALAVHMFDTNNYARVLLGGLLCVGCWAIAGLRMRRKVLELYEQPHI